MEKRNQSIASLLISTIIVAVAAASSINAQTIFSQPQSHLGRLVQSITSPLVLSAAGNSYDGDSPSASGESPNENYDSSDSLAPTSGGYSTNQQQNQQNNHYQHYRPAAAQTSNDQASRYQQHRQHQQTLQQAPSQQNGIPQHYPESSGADETDDDNYGAPSSSGMGGFRQKHQQLNSQQQHRGEQQPAGANYHQEYRMGAYLGPTIDDKEIQGAFNSNNDDRDEDDGPAGYQGPPAGGQRASTSGSSADSYGTQQHFGTGASDGSGYGPSRPSSSNSYGRPSNYDSENDSSSADEDGDEPSLNGGQQRGLNQAASQYHKQQQPRAKTNQQLAMAANGYVPYGQLDLIGLMGAANGGQGQGMYEVYNGDGSYAGPAGFGNGPYGAPQRGNGRRQQAASMNSQFDGYGNGYGPNGGPRQQQQQAGSGDADDDSDIDED